MTDIWAFALQPDIAGPPATTTIATRRISGVLALLPALLLYLLYRVMPRPYIKAWIAMWLGLAMPLFVGSISAGPNSFGTDEWRTVRLNVARVVVAISALAWLGGMTMVGISAGWIRSQMRWPRWLFPAGILVSAWFLIGSVTIGLIAVTQSALVLGSVLFAADAILFLQLARRERLYGALIIGLVLSVIPIDMLSDIVSNVTTRGSAIEAWVWTLVYALLALGMHLVVFEDVTSELRQRNDQLRAAQAELKARVVTDPLTGCYNRRFFDEIGPHELKRHQRYGLPLSLLFFDCDRFKQVNDTLGHEVGDRVLEAVGRVIRSQVRGTDYVFRWGGDEFLALVTCDEARAAEKAAQIKSAFSFELLVQDLPEATGLSIGWVEVPAETPDLAPFVEIADEKMYAKKATYTTGT